MWTSSNSLRLRNRGLTNLNFSNICKSPSKLIENKFHLKYRNSRVLFYTISLFFCFFVERATIQSINTKLTSSLYYIQSQLLFGRLATSSNLPISLLPFLKRHTTCAVLLNIYLAVSCLFVLEISVSVFELSFAKNGSSHTGYNKG